MEHGKIIKGSENRGTKTAKTGVRVDFLRIHQRCVGVAMRVGGSAAFFGCSTFC